MQPTELRQRLERSLSDATPANAALAAYFLNNLADLPFETAATVGAKVGVSEATVGRFCRSLGYRHFKELKTAIQSDIGDKAWLIGDRLQGFVQRLRSDASQIARGVEREIAAIVANYETATQPDFARAVQRLARSRHVFVCGFQTERGHGAHLAHCLQYLRPNVHVLDIAGGTFAEALLLPPEDVCIVLFEGRRYSRMAQRLMSVARQKGIAVTLVTDPYCAWARGLASEVFVVQTDLNQFWDATPAMSSLIALMVNGVFSELGPEVEDRMSQVSELYNEFVGHVGGQRRSD